MKEAMIYEIKESQNKQSKSNQLNKMIMVINKEKIIYICMMRIGITSLTIKTIYDNNYNNGDK